MKGTYSALMQSRFFNPAFNSAIFDGPVRIYFAQFHESLALKIYFSLQQNFGEQMAKAKELHKVLDRTVLVMLYPSSDSFQMSFEGGRGLSSQDDLYEDTIIGVNGPFEDDQLPLLLQQITQAFKDWEKVSFPNPVIEATI